jgi:hypothetical protein
MVHIIVVLIYYCIDLKKLWLDSFDKVVVLVVVVLVHPPNLGLIIEDFVIMSQPSIFDWQKKVLVERASQSTHQAISN